MMLADELQLLRGMLAPPDPAGLTTCTDCSVPEAVTKETGRISEAWRLSRLRITDESTLCRYLNFHLEELSGLSDLYACAADGGHPAVRALLLQLAGQLTGYLKDQVGTQIIAPRIWCEHSIAALAPLSKKLITGMTGANLDPELHDLISNFIRDAISSANRRIYTFRTLGYIRRFLEELSVCDFCGKNIEDEINERLFALEFNHLAYFYYRQHQLMGAIKKHTSLQERLTYFQGTRTSLLSKPAQLTITYDPRWPSLKTMMGEWLKEEIHQMEKQQLSVSNAVATRAGPEKIPLGISVAYLACFVKVFLAENVMPSTNLAGTFRFISAHCRTKKQPVISPGSLSKEFYSIDQHTAARVREILKKMVSTIDHQFFP
jgi:hypothetical protein